MKNRIYIYPLLLLAFLGCNRVLDLQPLDIINEEDAFSSESGVNAYMVRMYANLPIENFNYSSDKGLNFNSEQGVGLFTLDNLTDLSQNIVSDDPGNGYNNNVGGGYWDYGHVRTINQFLHLLDQYANNFNAGQVDAWKAEALALRAWTYYAMVKRYGGVPIVTEMLEWNGDNLQELMLPRNSEEESWNFILDDLDEAITALPEDNQGGRINKYSALTLKAEAAITAASIAKYGTLQQLNGAAGGTSLGIPADRAAFYYTEALNACKAVIDAGKYSLARGLDPDGGNNYYRLFLNPEGHNESIFVEYFNFPQKTHSWDTYFISRQFWNGSYSSRIQPTLDLVERYAYRDGRAGTIIATDPVSGEPVSYPTATAVFDNRDFRFWGTVMYPGSEYQTQRLDIRQGLIDTDGKKITTDTNVDGIPVKGAGGMGGNSETTRTGFYLRKYIDETKATFQERQSDQDWIVMRYAEVLLMAAEAAVELGGTELNDASIWLNDIRDRAGLLPLTADQVTINQIRNEYICEFAFENKVFWYYKRWRIFDEIITNNYRTQALLPFLDIRDNSWQYEKTRVGNIREFQNRHYYQQIPPDQITRNPSLVQNPGY